MIGISLLLLLALLLSAFFSGIETGFVSLSPIKIQVLRRKNPKLAVQIRRLRRNWNLFLSITLIGNDLSVVSASSLFTYLCSSYLGINNDLVITVTFAIVMLVFGEAGPKVLFRYYAEKLVPLALPVFEFFRMLFFPFAIMFTYFSEAILKLMGGQFYQSKGIFVTREELRMLLYQGSTASSLHREERTLIRRIFDFSAKKAKDIMLPIEKVVCVERDWDLSRIMHLAREKEFSRYPVREDHTIVGFVHILDLLYMSEEDDWRQYIRPIVFIHEETPVGQVFYQMQSVRSNIVVVHDPQHRPIGIITMKDVMDEVVGEVV